MKRKDRSTSTTGLRVLAVALAWTVASATATRPALAGEPPDPRIAQARAIVKDFATTLQRELQTALQAGGPVAAVAVCHSRAPAIASQLSDKYGWDVSRTSLKTRNPANRPDDWERRVLEQFEARRAAGESPATLEHGATVADDGGTRFRFMKAIPTQAVCLACHGGATVPPAVEDKLAELYPDDQARGFAEGDLRGAFTLSTPAPSR